MFNLSTAPELLGYDKSMQSFSHISKFDKATSGLWHCGTIIHILTMPDGKLTPTTQTNARNPSHPKANVEITAFDQASRALILS